MATALARRLGLAETEVADVYWTALLEHVGCTGFAHEAASRYGDDLMAGAAAARTNVADPRDLFATFLPAVAGGSRLAWIRIALMELTTGTRVARQFAAAACEVGRATAQRLGLPTGVQRGLHEVFESWNGSGGAQGLKGDAISLPARIAQLSATATHFDTLGGPALAVDAVRKQSGGVLDPELASAFEADFEGLLATAGADDLHAAALDTEPRPVRTLPASRLLDVAAAFGDIADLKTPHLLGHSSGVARIAREAPVGSGSTRWTRTGWPRLRSSTTSGGWRSRPASGTRRARSAARSGSRCGCTPTTPNGSSRDRRGGDRSRRPPGCTTNDSTAPAITARRRLETCPPPQGSSRRPTRTRR